MAASPLYYLVSRIIASSTTLEMELSLDVAVDIYPISPSQSFSLQLVSTLHPGGNADEKKEVWRDGAGGIAEEWDYVMHGKVSQKQKTSFMTKLILISFRFLCRFTNTTKGHRLKQ